MNKDGIVKRIEELAVPLLGSEGLELVDIELKREGYGEVLRFYIDRESGIDLDTCSKASEVLSRMLDAEDPIYSSYSLEVSSPGIERPLKKPKDFKKFIGSRIFVKTRTKTHDKKHFTGTLKTATEETLAVECDDVTVEIPYNEVSKAHLVVDFDL